jgi:hypothetical protein
MQTEPDLQQLADRAAQIFLAPSHRYPWADIMTGCAVSSADGTLRQFRAVDKNTFRAIHREEKGEPVGERLMGYFVGRPARLARAAAHTCGLARGSRPYPGRDPGESEKCWGTRNRASRSGATGCAMRWTCRWEGTLYPAT